MCLFEMGVGDSELLAPCSRLSGPIGDSGSFTYSLLTQHTRPTLCLDGRTVAEKINKLDLRVLSRAEQTPLSGGMVFFVVLETRIQSLPIHRNCIALVSFDAEYRASTERAEGLEWWECHPRTTDMRLRVGRRRKRRRRRKRGGAEEEVQISFKVTATARWV